MSCVLYVYVVRYRCLKYVQKRICLRTIFTICLSLQAKCEIPVFRVHPLARSTVHILSFRTFGDHPFSPPIGTVQIFVWRSHACTTVCASAVTWLWSLLLYRLCVPCYHNCLLCVRITWKCECFKVLKISLFSILPVPTRKTWNSPISCTPTSPLVGVQIFISGDQEVHDGVSWLRGGCRMSNIGEKCVFRRLCFTFSR